MVEKILIYPDPIEKMQIRLKKIECEIEKNKKEISELEKTIK